MDIRQEQRPPDRRPLGAAVAATVVAALWVLAACSAAAPGRHPSPQPPTSETSVPPRSSPAWLLTRSALSQLIADPATRAKLRGALIYEILQPGQQPLAGITAKPVMTFASATALEDAVTGGRLRPDLWRSVRSRGLVLYPRGRAAGSGAGRRPGRNGGSWHGLRLDCNPALNLTTVLGAGTRSRGGGRSST